MKKRTLADRVRNFSKVKLGKVSVRVPQVNVKAKANASGKKEEEQLPLSSMVNLIIKAAIEKSKRERKEKSVEEDKSYKILKEDKGLIFDGGYGTVSKGYGGAPRAAYVDYEKLFSHLGSFRAKQPYDNMAEHLGAMNKAAESGGFSLIQTETMDKIGRYVKYLKPANPTFDIHTMAMSLVPMAGMSSGEWEQFRLWLQLDPVMYALKIKTS